MSGFVNLVRASTIGGISSGSKNSSKEISLSPVSFDSQLRGLQCEEVVCADYIRRGFTVVARRFQSPFAEIDLVLRDKSGGWTLVEVKSLNLRIWLGCRLKRRQKERLARAHEYFSAKVKANVEFHLAVVGHDGSISIFKDSWLSQP